MPAAQQALSLLSRWPSAAAGTSSAVRGAACLLCQPAAHAAVLSHSNQWGCLPAPQLPQHSSAAGVDQHDAWRAAYCHLPQPCAELPAIERRSTASAASTVAAATLGGFGAPAHCAAAPREAAGETDGNLMPSVATLVLWMGITAASWVPTLLLL